MVRTQAGLSCEAREIVRAVGIAHHHPHSLCHSRNRTLGPIGRTRRESAIEPNRLRSQLNAELLPRCISAAGQGGASSRNQRRQDTHRRQTLHFKPGTSTSGPGLCRQALKELRGIRKRNTAVPRAVRVPALEILPSVPEQKRSRSHQIATRPRTVLKRASGDDGDDRASVALFKGPGVRTRGADQVGYGPTIPASEAVRSQRTGYIASLGSGYLSSRFDRNFRQESLPSQALIS